MHPFELGQTVQMTKDVAPHAGLVAGAHAIIGAIWHNQLIVVNRYGINCFVQQKDVTIVEGGDQAP